MTEKELAYQRVYKREYRKKYKDKVNKQARESYQRRRLRVLAKAKQKWIEQKVFGPCPLCSVECWLVYDHDHATNKFRGRICWHCNLMLGYARDSVDTLRQAVVYLEAQCSA